MRSFLVAPDAESSSVVGRLSVWEGTISGLSEQRLSLQRELAEVQQANSGLTESLDSKVLRVWSRAELAGVWLAHVECWLLLSGVDTGW